MKRTFKDFAAQDIQNVFVNQGEFAEPVTINHMEMMIVRDDEVVNPTDTKMRMGDVSKQLAVYDVSFHVAASYFEHIPPVDELMDFEGEEYRIKSVSDNLGMLTIGLSRVDS